MKKLNPHKVFAQYRDTMAPYEPLAERKYTITHSDATAEVFVFISSKYAEDKINRMRDEVKLAWELHNEKLALMGSVIIDGKGIIGPPKVRNTIFYNEMPTALQALRQADRFIFDNNPKLDSTPVFIHFISSNPAYDKTHDFGPIGNYK